MSLPEDDGMAHGHVQNSLMQVRKVAMVIPSLWRSVELVLAYLLEKKRSALLALRMKGV